MRANLQIQHNFGKKQLSANIKSFITKALEYQAVLNLKIDLYAWL